jgi:hypothetical protein
MPLFQQLVFASFRFIILQMSILSSGLVGLGKVLSLHEKSARVAKFGKDQKSFILKGDKMNKQLC